MRNLRKTRGAATAAVLFTAAALLAQGCPSAPNTADSDAPSRPPASTSPPVADSTPADATQPDAPLADTAPADAPPAAVDTTNTPETTAAAGEATAAETIAAETTTGGPATTVAGGTSREDEHGAAGPAGGADVGAATAEISDPVASNRDGAGEKQYAPYFAGWEKPVLTLFFSGRQHGYIEPCGCTGLSNQKGGLNRRHSFFRRLKERGWNPVAIDLGNQIRRFGRQPEIKFHTTIGGMKKIGYQAIGFGPDDLRVSSTELLSAMIGVDGQPAPFVSANVNVLGQSKPFLVVEAAGRKIGVTSVLAGEESAKVNSDEIALQDAAEALTVVAPKLAAQKCDLYVLLAHASTAESEALARKFPLFDLVVNAGAEGEPAHRLIPVEGAKGQLVQVGYKGMYVSAVGVYAGRGKDRFRLQRAALDGRFPDSKEMLGLMASYQQQLEAMGLEGLAVKPQPHPSGRRYVGSAACADCHADEYEIWEGTPHAHATDSLVHPGERSEIPRHHDPECLSCHVTGWNPQEYYPYQSGYLALKKTAHLTQVGCENCHGPGSRHVGAELGEIDGLTEAQQEKYREEMVLTLKDARQTCLRCHDLDNSPDFHADGAFERFWEQVSH